MSSNPTPVCIVGAPGSPYSRKMLSVLRYRRIPHRWISQGSPESNALPAPKVELLPRLLLPNEAGELVAKIDSTPLIRELEVRFPDAERSLVPPDPALAFLDALLEDYGDEWLTKAMFHYRWAYPADIAKAAAILPRWFRTNQPEQSARAFGEEFAKRQIDRLWVVGSNETTAPVIEASYRRLLTALDAHLTTSRFVWGERPGAGDFALFGQLTQLAGFDPTPAALTLETAPRIVAWVDLVDDLSGIESSAGAEHGWPARDALPASLREIFVEIGRVYPPFLLANAEALAAGRERVECSIDGAPWVQKPFPYQAKCLQWLREAHEGLASEDRRAVDSFLAGTGCEALFG